MRDKKKHTYNLLYTLYVRAREKRLELRSCFEFSTTTIAEQKDNDKSWGSKQQ